VRSAKGQLHKVGQFCEWLESPHSGLSAHLSDWTKKKALGPNWTWQIADRSCTDVSDLIVIIYKGGATSFRDQFLLAGKTPTQTIAGKDVYLIDNPTDGLYLLANDGIALVEANDISSDPLQASDIDTVFQAISDGVGFIGSGDGMDGVTFIDVTPGDVQDVPSAQATETLDGGLSYSIIDSGYTPGQILCFGSGTLITTIDGETPVENLKLTDQILTLDDGHQPLRWIGSNWLNNNHLKHNPKKSCERSLSNKR
jgi:hypothetical protein